MVLVLAEALEGVERERLGEVVPQAIGVVGGLWEMGVIDGLDQVRFGRPSMYLRVCTSIVSNPPTERT